MKNIYIVAGVSAVVFFQGCIVTRSNGEPVASAQARVSESTANDAAKGKAIEVASKGVIASRNPSRQAPTPCPLLSSGRLEIYEDGTEQVISKSGDLLATRHIPQLATRRNKEWVSSKMDKEGVIDMTKDDARKIYLSLDKFEISACELPAVWRVVYELKDDISGGGPDYVVDKKSGQIIYKRYSQ